ncbi:glucose-6-phosphate isomerase [Pseudomonas sp. WN033]|nr:glucose-6-phosphate isomerase [Pseudomonas sp. WN033]
MTAVNETQWVALEQHRQQIQGQHLARLFAADSERFERLHRRLGPLLLDFSKQRLNEDTLQHLFALADAYDLRGWINRLFAGEPVNHTEGRPAMHWALRLPAGKSCVVDGEDVTALVQAQLERMDVLVSKIHAGQWRGATGEVITDVVNIGVGGSDLGPLMVSEALADFAADTAAPLRMHFASTMDGSQLAQLLRTLDPHATLFVISSKSFTTVDTLSNAATARQWLERTLGDCAGLLDCHFLGVSSAAGKMTEWGIAPDNQLQIWDWVGGRYSFWSAIGLPIALTVGMQGFRDLLAGAHAVDEHFRQAEWAQNVPVLMALIGVWNVNVLGINALAVLPYDGRLKQLPLYLEQLEMESNGKSVRRDGTPVEHSTCPIIWGDVGPNAQHAFYQLLHQGTEAVTCDFIMPARRYREQAHSVAARELLAQHELALANCLAQSRLLALGDGALDDPEALPAYQRYRGNQPSSTLLLDELTPYTLGMLIALYEHKVFVQSVLWDINPFDQWGVEMGKRIAVQTLERLRGAAVTERSDASTEGLLAFIQGNHK